MCHPAMHECIYVFERPAKCSHLTSRFQNEHTIPPIHSRPDVRDPVRFKGKCSKSGLSIGTSIGGTKRWKPKALGTGRSRLRLLSPPARSPAASGRRRSSKWKGKKHLSPLPPPSPQFWRVQVPLLSSFLDRPMLMFLCRVFRVGHTSRGDPLLDD